MQWQCHSPAKQPFSQRMFTQPDRQTSGKRRAITLLEVVLALAIFVASFAMISEILRNGARAASKSQLKANAIVRCENQLNQILADIVPMQSSGQTAFEDDPDWVWTLTVSDGGVANLLKLELTVEHLRKSDRSVNESVTLTRMIRDPQVFLDAALESEDSL